jgi:hypothetical protein
MLVYIKELYIFVLSMQRGNDTKTKNMKSKRSIKKNYQGVDYTVDQIEKSELYAITVNGYDCDDMDAPWCFETNFITAQTSCEIIIEDKTYKK